MNKYNFKILSGLIIVLVGVISWITFGAKASSSFIYVDTNYSGTEEGSSSKPYIKIQKAIDKAKNENKNVYIRSGKYKENLKLWKGVELVGKDRDKVEIKAKDDNDPVIKMYDNTEIHHLTVKKGQYGVLINNDSKAHIGNCRIIDNKDDGVFVEEASTKDEKIVEIYDSIIAHNGWDGIYSEKRKISIKNNEIFNNDKDGIAIGKGSKGVIEGNRVKDNDGVGLRITIDGSELYIKNNTFRDNNKSGLEVGSEGVEGLIDLNHKNKFYKNDKYGIVKVGRANFSAEQWNKSFKIDGNIKYWDNVWGNISHIIRVY